MRKITLYSRVFVKDWRQGPESTRGISSTETQSEGWPRGAWPPRQRQETLPQRARLFLFDRRGNRGPQQRSGLLMVAKVIVEPGGKSGFLSPRSKLLIFFFLVYFQVISSHPVEYLTHSRRFWVKGPSGGRARPGLLRRGRAGSSPVSSPLPQSSAPPTTAPCPMCCCWRKVRGRAGRRSGLRSSGRSLGLWQSLLVRPSNGGRLPPRSVLVSPPARAR